MANDEIKVTVIEQPGKLGTVKARTLSRLLQQFWLNAPPELRDEINRRAEELRKERKHD